MQPSVKRNFLERALNKLGRPLGMVPFPVAWEVGGEFPFDRNSIFDTICDENYWGSHESVSGPGSELARTARYRESLIAFLREKQVNSLFDAPCGDLNWMHQVLQLIAIRYIGGDVSGAVLRVARARNADLDLRHFDICTDAFPKTDVWHCRDVFLHLSFNDIWLALANAARSEVKFALVTTYRSRFLRNLDVETGGWRYLDLERPPFRLARPLLYLDDRQPGDLPRAVGVWPMDSIRAAVAARA